MPGWLQAFVKVNPVTYLTEAERALLTGGPAATAVVERSLLWALGIFVVFAPLAVAAYRRRTGAVPAAGARQAQSEPCTSPARTCEYVARGSGSPPRW